MKKIFFLLFVLLIVSSCGNSNQESEKKRNIEIAEKYIEQFQPEKAVPYLKKIESNDPDYGEAQELLSTIETVNKVDPDNGNLKISEEEKNILRKFQTKWAKEQIDDYEGYFIDFTIENSTTINFTLSKDASEVSTIKSHEEIHVPILKNRYSEALIKNNLPNYPIEFQFFKSI